MKKSILFVAALALTFAACQPNEPQKALQVADFENLTIAEENVMHLNATGTFESGDFIFDQEVADYGEYGLYYFGNVPSNKTSKTYDAYADSDKSASGGAFAGHNFVVWTTSYTGVDAVALKEAAVVPGMYVNNTAWVVDAIVNGDGMSTVPGGFTADDYFKLTISAELEGKAVNNKVVFYLANGTSYINEWTYVDLSSLGKVDKLHFALESTKKNDYGMTTPAYFCIDNLGSKKLLK